MNELFIGTYQLGWRWVDVYGQRNERSGAYFFMPDDKPSHARIKVGMDHGSAADAFQVLAHEAFEFLADEGQCRYRKTGSYEPNASDNCFFIMDHSAMTEIIAKTGWFLHQIKKDFDAAYELLK